MKEEQLRKRFEAWMHSSVYERTTERTPSPKYTGTTLGRYRDINVEMAWQAVRDLQLKLPEPIDVGGLSDMDGSSEDEQEYYCEGWNRCLNTIEEMNNE